MVPTAHRKMGVSIPMFPAAFTSPAAVISRVLEFVVYHAADEKCSADGFTAGDTSLGYRMLGSISGST